MTVPRPSYGVPPLLVVLMALGAIPCHGQAPAPPPEPALVAALEHDPSILTRPLEPRISSLGTSRLPNGRARLASVTFLSHNHADQPVRIFGYLAVPPGDSQPKLPGLVIIHGGGGRAVLHRATEGAANGFVALAIDLPGRGPRRSRSRSGGPDMTVQNLFRVTPSLQDNYLHHSVLAALRSIEFLRQRPEVDPDRVALYGISWGGAVSLIAGSLDARLAGVVDLFGSGYVAGMSAWDGYLERIGAEKTALWTANLDPSVYVPRMRPPAFLVTGTNDGCYYLPRFLRTLETVGSEARLLLHPNLNHRLDAGGDTAIWAWLRLVVRDGVPAGDMPRFGAVRVAYEDGEAQVAISLAIGGKLAVQRVTVAYADASAGWTQTRWQVVPAPETRPQWFTAEVPFSGLRTYAFATVECSGGTRVSTPVHTFVRPTVNGQQRIYHVPFLSDPGVAVPVSELARDLELDADARIEEARSLLPDPSTTAPVQPRAHELDGELYVSIAEVASLMGASVNWSGGELSVSGLTETRDEESGER